MRDAWKDWGKFAAAMVVLGFVIGVSLWFVHGVDHGLAVAIAFGLPTFIFAVHQFRDAHQTIHGLRSLSDRLEVAVSGLTGRLDHDVRRLEQELSTRRLGEAPDFMADVARLIQEAKDGEIIIFCDFPAYTVVIGPSEYKNYVHAIKARKKGVQVKLMCADKDGRQDLAREFYGSHTSELESQFRTVEDFLHFVNDKNAHALDDPFGDADKCEISRVMPLHFWIVGDRAIFSLQRYTERGAHEVGFQTRDRSLVKSLRGIFEHYAKLERASDGTG
jgi:hypothetical protein